MKRERNNKSWPVILLFLSLIAFPITSYALQIYDSTISNKGVKSTANSIAATKNMTTYGVQNQYGIPVGMIVAWGSGGKITTSDSFKWLECNGKTFDKNKYPELYAVLGTNTLPNLNNQFLRSTTNTDIVLKPVADSIASHNSYVVNPNVTGNLISPNVTTTLKSTSLTADLVDTSVTTTAKDLTGVTLNVEGTAAGQEFEGTATGTVQAMVPDGDPKYVAKLDSSDDSFNAVDFTLGSKVSQEKVVCGEEEKTYDCEPCNSYSEGPYTRNYWYCNFCMFSCNNHTFSASSKNYSGPSCTTSSCIGSLCSTCDPVSVRQTEPCGGPYQETYYDTVTVCAKCTKIVPVYCYKPVTGITDVKRREITASEYTSAKSAEIQVDGGVAKGTTSESTVTGTATGDITIPVLQGTVTNGRSIGSLDSGAGTGKVDNTAVTGKLTSSKVEYTGVENPYTGLNETAPMHTFVRYFIRAIP